ncbi:MAG: DUF4012 domain-containing protein [Candidatus Yanofskybacteria bacterium]|nr:DUF4012 domain-containing protein [Candidatus Yanofskybacteria bacterium]
MPKKNILLAMFDIRPTIKSAGFIFSQIKRELNLQAQKTQNLESKKTKTVIEKTGTLPEENYWEELMMKLPQRPDFPKKYELTTFSKGAILKELERTMSESIDVNAELASVGGRIHQQISSGSRVKFVGHQGVDDIEPTNIVSNNENLKNFWNSVAVESVFAVGSEAKSIVPEMGSDEQTQTIHAADVHQHSPASREIEIWLENLQKNRELLSHNPALEKGKRLSAAKSKKAFFKGGAKWSSWFRFNRKAMVFVASIALPGLLILGLVRHRGIWARNNIIQNGNNAMANLEEAKRKLEDLSFIGAADSFALAYDDLNRASGTLNQLGASFLSVFGELPGLNKIKTANNLVEAGQSLSKAGENLSLAFGTLYKTNLLAFLDPSVGSSGRGLSGSQKSSVSISKLLTEFKDILNFADKNINRADRLLADIDAATIPSDKQELFISFKNKIPEFQRYIGEAADYSDFLLKLVGSDSPKTYLILLQNNSELRPTGGFPGTYGLITFENGTLKKIFVEDIYRADANLKENIIPPIPLQHITPSWGMRDAAWFADFPTSARKVMEFYKLDGGTEVDGVLTITPDVIAKIFEIVGPIEMSEYGLTLGADNFLTEIQNEVEYVADRSAPKQILTDLQPKFFERLAQQDKDQWLAIFNIISEAVKQKHVLAYFQNSDLENMALKNELSGEIKHVGGDYLQVVFANVKGSKTDFVTENSMNLKTEIGVDGALEHTLKINRAHNGGGSKYGFYNRDNPAYIKVYVPKGSSLESIQGHSITDFKSLINYDNIGFKRDQDLARVEDGTTRPFAGVDAFEESGKTVFGFWLITKPQQTKSVVLKYSTPFMVADGKYNLLWQKQSGTGQDQISFSFKLPEGENVLNQSAGLQTIGDNLVLNSDLSIDREININFR